MNTAYVRTPKAQNFTENALTKVIVYFKNEPKGFKYHSRDRLREHSLPNRDVGIIRLKKMVEKFQRETKGGGVIRAILIDCTTEVEFERYEDGIWKSS